MLFTKQVTNDMRRMTVVILQSKDSAHVYELEEALKQQRVALAEFEQKIS
jgi:hypothetical protein